MVPSLLDAKASAHLGGADPTKPVDLQPLHAKIDQLTLENDFLERALAKAGSLRIPLIVADDSGDRDWRHE